MSKKKTQTQAPIVEPVETPEPPKCPDCLKILDWRDAAYVLGSSLCKRCHQRDQRKRLQGEFHPAVQLVQRGNKLVEVAVRNNRAQRRHGQASLELVETPAPKKHTRTRAERRYATRKAKAIAA